MIRLVLSIFILSAILKVTLGDSKRKRDCPQSDFRGYSKCIREKETQPEAVNWCSAQGCSLCLGNSCQPICKGFACGACPNGNCCNGKNCNACYNGNCCSTPSCNYCLNTCRQTCANEISCLNICVPQCQNDTNEVFVIPTQSHIPGKLDVVVYIKGIGYPGQVISGHLPITNRTAVVSVDGVDRVATILFVPPTSSCQKEGYTSGPYRDNQRKGFNENPNPLPNGCCHVVHPLECYNDHIYPYRHCYRRTHQECSNLCSSQFVHLTRTPTPRFGQQNQCRYTKSYPYIDCGQQSVLNCDSCYVCNGQYNPNYCVKQRGCSSACRQNFSPPDLSNLHAQPGLYNPQHNSVYPGLPERQGLLQFGGAPVQYG